MAQQRIVVEGHRIVWAPKSSIEYSNMLSQNAVDLITTACGQLRATGNHRDVDLACSIERAIKQFAK